MRSRVTISESKIVKMPRVAYKEHFARDAYKTYIGTEPERRCTAHALTEEFGIYQDFPAPRWLEIKRGSKVYLVEADEEWDGKEGSL